jgi:hypothetical protein
MGTAMGGNDRTIANVAINAMNSNVFVFMVREQTSHFVLRNHSFVILLFKGSAIAR